MDIFKKLPDALLPWYEENKRQLPWREDRDPYHIWVSEIMLQQTRVEAVKGYYSRFLSAYPTVQDLAAADDEQLHKLWEGLGYYNRVRNMKKAASVVVQTFHSSFPKTYAEVLDLPGIGEYTAGAICSIAYDLPTPAVDGNVLRVVSRLTDDDTFVDSPKFKKDVHLRLAEIYPKQAGAFTQALMELGATVCGPNRKPMCDVCPCRDFCLGHIRGTAENLPRKSPKRSRKTEKLTVFVLSCDGRYALQKRDDKGLLAGLWQFPNVPGKLGIEESLTSVSKMDLHPKEIQRIVSRKHIFTHIQWDMIGVYMEVKTTNNQFCWLTEQEIKGQAALPTAFRQFWEEIQDV